MSRLPWLVNKGLVKNNYLQKKFFSSLLLLFFLNLLVKPIWIFGIDRQVQNIAGTNDYGEYFAIFNLGIILNFLLDIGLTNFLNQKLSSDKLSIDKTFNQIGLLKIFLGILYAILLVSIAIITGIHKISWLILLGMNQFLFSFFLFLRAHITALQLFHADAWLSVVDKLLMILACGILIYFPQAFGRITIYLFLLIQMIAVMVSTAVAFLIILYKEKGKLFIRARLDTAIIRSALPFGLIVLVMSVHSRLDGFLLERVHANGAFEAGIYSQAYRLLDTSNMVGYLAAGFVLPFAAKAYNEGTMMKPIILKIRNLLLAFNGSSILFCFLFSKKIEQMLYHTDNTYGASIIGLTMPALVGYSLVQIYGSLLTATGNIWSFVIATIPFLLLNAFLNIIFIPRYGAMACCIIAIITQTTYGLVIMYIANKKIDFTLSSS